MSARLCSPLVFALLVSVGLAGCQSSEERAQDHYESATELLAEGDPARAYLEFRNALKFQPNNTEFLEGYAEALAENGRIGAAYRQRLRLAELQPEDFEANVTLARMAVILRDWQTAEPYIRRAAELDPEAPETEELQLALAYRDAADNGNRRQAIFERVEELRETLPESRILRTISLDVLLREGRNEEALQETEALIEKHPEAQEFYRSRLQVLARLGREEAVEQTLRQIVDRFPEDEESKALLVRYYLSREEIGKAEEFLREEAEIEGENQQARRLTLVRFLREVRGRDAALAEIERLIEAGIEPEKFRAMRAALQFEAGEREQAIADLRALLADAEPSGQTRENKILLAGLLQATGNEVGARQLVEEVLSEDPGMIPALKMRAGWQIGDDRAEEAINTLRTVLNEAPGDVEALTMLARAHMRSGSRQLAGETLAQAVRASSNAPEPSLRYASFLTADGNLSAAATVLADALRISPQNVDLLAALGEIYIQLEEWSQAQAIERRLRDAGGEAALAAAENLKVAILSGQRGASDALAYLEGLAGEDRIPAQAAVVQMNLRMGNTERARSYLDDLLAQEPENEVYRLLDAALLGASGEAGAAAEQYRSLIADHPQKPRYYVELYRVLQGQGKDAEAREVVEDGLAAVPDAGDLLWIKAGLLEREGDTEGAIEIYERLYESQSGNSVVANNLASLLATTREDEESLDRAWRIARRLRDTEVPAFLDTYGWIAFRRGDYETALDALVPASEGMPEEPLVLYHLGETYAALGRPEEAREALEKAVRFAERSERSPDADIAERARAALDNLQ